MAYVLRFSKTKKILRSSPGKVPDKRRKTPGGASDVKGHKILRSSPGKVPDKRRKTPGGASDVKGHKGPTSTELPGNENAPLKIEDLAQGEFIKGMKEAREYVEKQYGEYQKTSGQEAPGGKPPIRIAFIDSGCDRDHPHFEGWDITCRTFTSSPGHIDPTGHGTKVIGLFCSMFTNTRSAIQIHSFKVPADQESLLQERAIRDALEEIHRAEPPFNIVNISGGWPGYPKRPSEQQNMLSDIVSMITDITQRTAVLCAALNEGINNDAKIFYPASDCIAIGSSTARGVRSDFTPQGRLLLFLAQGEDLRAPLSRQAPRSAEEEGNLYTSRCMGTSFATPLASAIVALIIIKAEAFELTDEEKESLVQSRFMKRFLRETTDYTHDPQRGYGPLRPQELLQDDDLFRSRLNKVLQRTELYRYGTDA